jgi:hypothetical protein
MGFFGIVQESNGVGFFHVNSQETFHADNLPDASSTKHPSIE